MIITSQSERDVIHHLVDMVGDVTKTPPYQASYTEALRALREFDLSLNRSNEVRRRVEEARSGLLPDEAITRKIESDLYRAGAIHPEVAARHIAQHGPEKSAEQLAAERQAQVDALLAEYDPEMSLSTQALIQGFISPFANSKISYHRERRATVCVLQIGDKLAMGVAIRAHQDEDVPYIGNRIALRRAFDHLLEQVK